MLLEFQESSYVQSYNTRVTSRRQAEGESARGRGRGKGWGMNAKRFSGNERNARPSLLIVNTTECGILFSASILFPSRSSAFISLQFFFLLHQPPPYSDALLRRGNSSLPSLTRPSETERLSCATGKYHFRKKVTRKWKIECHRADVLFFREWTVCARCVRNTIRER